MCSCSCLLAVILGSRLLSRLTKQQMGLMLSWARMCVYIQYIYMLAMASTVSASGIPRRVFIRERYLSKLR